MTPEKKRGRKPKASFYHTRWHKVGLNAERAAEIIGVTVDDVLRYDIEGNELAERFLLLWDSKHINHDGWNGWIFSQGCLVHKRQRFRPELILESRANLDKIQNLELELRKLESWSGIIKLIRRIIGKRTHENAYSRISRNVIYKIR